MVLGQTLLQVQQDLGCYRLPHSSAAAGALVSSYPFAEVVKQG